MTANLVISPTR